VFVFVDAPNKPPLEGVLAPNAVAPPNPVFAATPISPMVKLTANFIK
jgi:hypothetical protein